MTQSNPSELIKPLTIGEWLSENAFYRIPMYQRRYAWGAIEVEQLLHDLLNCPQDKPYYIGSLVVFKNKAENGDPISYEVIDGQQRLTTLLLIAAYFNPEEKLANRLQFENRPHSQSTLQTLFSAKAPGESNNAESAAALCSNFNVIKRFFERKDDKDKGQRLADFLYKKVVMMRIEVPPHTDVAHYFEIMNNRGEQLEMHEIVKARLLSALKDDPKARVTLNQVWDACTNMNQYVQFGFASEKREKLFGKDYQNLLPEDEDSLIDLLGEVNTADRQGDTLRNIIDSSKSAWTKTGNDLDPLPERFQSIVNFPNFLLLVLAIHAGQDKISENTLDDKKLIASFDSLLPAEADETSDNIKKFTLTLLRCRFMLDQFVIKRDKDDDEKLSLKRSARTGTEDKPTAGPFDDALRMLQAVFHVSHPRQAYKYWLLGTLHWLNKQVISGKPIQGSEFLSYLESLAAAFMRDRHLVPKNAQLAYLKIIFSNAGQPQSPLSQDIAHRLTYPNIDNIFVFNYLDYLLWQENRQQATPDAKISHFEFKIRGSIEHYYPQNPRDGHLPEWLPPNANDEIHAFGNLCLISHEKNSRLSDLLPRSKNEQYRNKPLDSIKQYKMMQAAELTGSWEPAKMKIHENEMIQLLRNKLSAQTTSTAQAQEKS
jgi:hypothetical protein